MIVLKQHDNPDELGGRHSTLKRRFTLPSKLNNVSDNKIVFGLFAKAHIANLIGDVLCKRDFIKHSNPGMPLITVITVVFNGENHLEQSINSVIDQSYQNIEYLLIDGGSTDKTLDIILQFEDKIDYWISEPDSGIADAMNKGLRAASGDYICFMHADDYFENDQSLSQAIAHIGDEDIALFDIIYGRNLSRLTSRGFNFWMNFKTGVYHQGVLCKRGVFEQIGGFDTEFKIAMDYDFFLRAYRHGMKARKHPLVLSIMRDTGISSRKDWPALFLRFKEEQKVHAKNCSSQLMALIYRIYWPLYLKYRQILHRCKS